MVGSNRTVLGNGIVHVVGDANVSPEQEKEIRRKLVEKALETLQVGKGTSLRVSCFSIQMCVQLLILVHRNLVQYRH